MNFLTISLAFAAGSMACAAFIAPSHAVTSERTTRKVTFARDVAPILYSKCAGCHHQGEVAPFSLMSYDDARGKAATIAAAVQQKFMPPWHAVSHGEFENDRSLTAAQIATLKDWSDEGSPAGDLSKAPKPPKFNGNWHIQQPEFAAKPIRPFEVAAEGPDVYRCFVLPTHFDSDRFVSDVELKPQNRKIVHHIVVYVSNSGEAKQLDGKDGQPGYSSFGGAGVQTLGVLAIWAPGIQAITAPKNTGMWLPKGADIILQVHYHLDGKVEKDQSEIGLKFASKPVDKRIRTSLFGNLLISIPKDSKDAEVKEDMYLAAPITIYDVFPHMHVLGHDMRMTATLPNGTKRELSRVDHYDFNWQTRYTYRQPVHLPKGTHLEVVSHYDNSSANLNNPNKPPKPVWWGEQTTNEMAYEIFDYSFDDEHLLTHQKSGEDIAVVGKSDTMEAIFDRYDTKRTGFLDRGQLTAVIDEYQVGASRPGEYRPEWVADYFIGVAGKTQKGKLSKSEFVTSLMSTHF